MTDRRQGSTNDPFADPGFGDDAESFMIDTTIALGRDVSLTLGTDSLIVLDEGQVQKTGSNCCGLLPNASKSTRALPYFNIIWATLSEFDLTIQYATPTSKDVVRVATLSYAVEKAEHPPVTTWVYKLLDRAYGASLQRKRIKVLINPFGGKGSAEKWYLRDIEPIFAAAQCKIDVERTQLRGHAIDIAEKLDVDAYDVVACCSGDGVPHEVFNGFGKRKDAIRALSNVAVVQLPCGSGNAMSLNLNGTDSTTLAALCVIKGLKTPLDLISVTQGTRRTLSFLSQSVGICAESDLGTENIRWMGSARFTYGILVRLLGKTVYPCDIAVKVDVADKASIRDSYRDELNDRTPASERRDPDFQGSGGAGEGLPPLKYGSAIDKLPDGWDLVPHDKLGNFFAGNMAWVAPGTNFFPASLPNDGHIDLVCINGDISRLSSLQTLMAVETNSFFGLEHVSYRKVAGYRIIPKNQKDGYISIDGERVPFEPFQAEIHRGLGTVLSKSGRMYEAPGVL
ncbi:MAG: hypothetical protein M1825_004108 [Sarcosagium campestre]|nr:MAG: hypothetical protein M1825_004108 [Sarcosagium campestre]